MEACEAIWEVSSPIILIFRAAAEVEAVRAARNCWNTVGRSLGFTAIPSWGHVPVEDRKLL